MQVLVVGSTGVIGQALLPTLQGAGHRVRALQRAPAPVPPGVDRVAGDLLDLDRLRSAVSDVDAVVNVASAIPTVPAPSPDDWAPNDLVRDLGTRNLLTAMRDASVTRLVHTSVHLVYGTDCGSRMLDEDAVLDPAPALRSAVTGERHVAAAADAGWLHPVILRPGWLYGAGSWHAQQLLRSLRDGKLPVPRTRDAWTSPVAATDVATAIRHVLGHAGAGHLFNVAGQPITTRALYTDLAAWLGWPAPGETTDAPARSLRLSTRRLEALGYVPGVPDARAGLAHLAERSGFTLLK